MTMLVVVTRDGNNQMLPLAWAVVEYEKKRHGHGLSNF